MERQRGGLHQKGKIYQQDVFSWRIQGTLKLLDVKAIKPHNTCTNQLASSVVFEYMSPSCCTGTRNKILRNDIMIYAVWPSTLCLIWC